MNEKSKEHKALERLGEKMRTTQGGRPLLDFPSLRTESALADQALRDAGAKKDRNAREQYAREMEYIRVNGGINRSFWNPEKMKHEYPGIEED